MNTAPSIYEYRNASEWEAAMNEWCAENEPKDNTNTQTLKSNTL